MRAIRLTFLALLVIAVAAPTLAQQPNQPPRPPQPPQGPQGANPGPPQGPPPGAQPGPPPDVVLREVLGFTEEQLAVVRELVETRQQTMVSLQQQIGEAERALGEAAHAAEPEPCQVGGAFLALEGLRRQMAQVQEAFRAGFDALLTGEQRQKVEEIFGVQRALAAADALHRLGL